MKRLLPLVFLLALASPCAYSQTFSLSPVSGDDWAQIQSALDQAQSGDTVLLAVGTYDISQRLFIKKSGVKLAGNAIQATIQPVGSFPAYSSDENCLICIWKPGTADAIQNIEIRNLTLDGISNNNAINAIFAKRGGGHWLHHLNIRHIAPENGLSAGIALSASQRVTISNCTIEYVGRDGISAAADSDYVNIRNNIIHYIGDYFASNNDSSTYNYRNTGLSIELTRTVDGNGTPVEGSDYGIIENNTVDGFISIGGSSYIAIRNNTIGSDTLLTRYAGIEIAGSSPDTPSESSVVISNNTIQGATAPGGIINGITFTANGSPVKYGLIHDNVFAKSDMAGINAEGLDGSLVSHLVFLNNSAEQGKSGGAFFEGDGEGITLTGNVRNMLFHNMSIHDNDRNGIKSTSQSGLCPDRLSIQSSRITNNHEASINGCNISGRAYSGTDLIWANNQVWGNQPDIQPGNKGYSGNQAPNANLVILTSSGSTSTFKLTIQDDDSTHEILWDFGDGIPLKQTISGSSATITHTYPGSAAYKTTVAVWDASGRSGFASVTPDHTSTGSLILAPVYWLLLD